MTIKDELLNVISMKSCTNLEKLECLHKLFMFQAYFSIKYQSLALEHDILPIIGLHKDKNKVNAPSFLPFMRHNLLDYQELVYQLVLCLVLFIVLVLYWNMFIFSLSVNL